MDLDKSHRPWELHNLNIRTADSGKLIMPFVEFTTASSDILMQQSHGEFLRQFTNFDEEFTLARSLRKFSLIVLLHQNYPVALSKKKGYCIQQDIHAR